MTVLKDHALNNAKVGHGGNAAISYPVNWELNVHKGTFALI